MKIRLILPIIKKISKKNKIKSFDSFIIKKRLKLLNFAMKWNHENIDLIVTSNNFFALKSALKLNCIKQEINQIKLKRDIVIGMGLLYAKNSFGGIKASVFYFKAGKKYKLTNQIWEVWNKTAKKNNKTFLNFIKQNRVVNLKDKTITLLSCGDILSKIHQKKGLPDTDIYLDLAHIDFKNYSINKEKHISWIQHWKGEEKIVLLTQQIHNKFLNDNNFFNSEQKKYKLIYPKNKWEKQNVTYFNRFFGEVQSNPSFIFVDVEI